MEKQFFSSRIRLRHIHCFVAVAQESNLGRAAARLRLTQPAVSKTLLELEELAGARLFDRGRHGAQLTSEGSTFLAHALLVLEALQSAARSVGTAASPGARAIAIAALPTVAPDSLPAVIALFSALHPEASIAVQTAANTALMSMLKSGEIELALGRMSDPERMAGLSFELLYMEPLVLVARAGHPLSSEAGTATLAQALSYPLVVFGKGTVPRHHTEAWLRRSGLKLPASCTETMSVSFARLLVRQSDTLWFTPAGAVRADIADGLLRGIDIQPGADQEAIGLLRRIDRGSDFLLDEFVRLLRDSAASRA
ncbi:MAG: LysR substrate-binding domain-containing protein [Noviherbaspirillum sp.]